MANEATGKLTGIIIYRSVDDAWTGWDDAEVVCPVTRRGFVFEPRSLVELRESLSLNQARMALALGVPTNTLSRWETGATTPDAATLAAVYSLATDHDIDPHFSVG